MDGMPDTHVVTNQVPPLENYNPATSPMLVEALIREGGQWGLDEVNEVGALSRAARRSAGANSPTAINPSCIPMTAPGTGWMRSSSTRLTTS
jgi:hypothetical protein